MDEARRGHGVYPIIDDADLYGAGCSGPAVEAGSGLTVPGLGRSRLLAFRHELASRFQKSR